MDASTTSAPPAYSNNEVRLRIALYAGVAGLMSVLSSASDLAAMPDEQLHAMSGVRWALKITILVVSAVIAVGNTIRAAIDRSTSGGGALTADTTPTKNTP